MSADYWNLPDDLERVPEYYAELERVFGPAPDDSDIDEFIARHSQLSDEEVNNARKQWRDASIDDSDRMLAGLQLFVAQTLQGVSPEAGLLQELATRIREVLWVQGSISEALPLPWDVPPPKSEGAAEKTRQVQLAICADMDFLLAQGWSVSKALERCAEHYPRDLDSVRAIHYKWRRKQARLEQIKGEVQEEMRRQKEIDLEEIKKILDRQG